MSQKEPNGLKKLDIFIVRFLPLLLFLFLGGTIIDCWNGVFRYAFSLLHSNSIFYALALFLISLADKRYHCIWNRAMYIELIVFPLISYIDEKTGMFPDAESLLILLSVTWFVTAFASVVLAVRHFLKPRIRKYKKGRDGHGR